MSQTTGWINNLLVPETGRIYAFYTFNCNNVTTAPATGERLPNANLLGCWCYRFSDDGGLSWSPDRYNLTAAQAIADIDRSNAWGGAVLEGWSVGKPLIADDNTTVLMQFSKVSSIAGRSEGFFFRSTTALAPHTPASGGLGFELVPPQPSDPTAPWHGLRAITGTHAEEGSVVQLPRAGSYYAVYVPLAIASRLHIFPSDCSSGCQSSPFDRLTGHLCALGRRFRTTNTFLGAATSVDGVSWIDGLIARHDRIDYGPAMYLDKIKQPTGPITPRRFRNGMFLMTVYADQQVYPDLYGFGSRNPYWVVPGWERTGEAAVLWGQPEVLLYTLPPCEDARCGIGYPDFIETETGDIFITETDKVKSRVHPLPASFLTQLWQQGTIAEVAPAGKLIDQEFPAGHTQTVLPAPPWGAVNLSAGGGFAVEVDLNTASIPVGLARGVPLVDCRPSATVPGGAQSGIVVTFTKERVGSSWVHCVNVTMTDSTGRNQSWDTDAEARLWLQQTHRVALSVDGLARVVSSVVNGVFGSGGSQRPQGWAHLDPRITAVGSASGPKCTVHPAVTRLRVYNRYLSTTEMIGNWRADQEK